MKNLNLIILLFSVQALMCQENEIKITPDGIAPIVVSVDSLSASEIYDRAKVAIVKLFKNPKYAIKADEPGKLIRFEGYRFYSTGLSSEGNYNYTCELEFKNGRYKISFFEVYLDKGLRPGVKDVFNKKGEIRNYDYYRNLYDNFTALTNDLHTTIKNKIVSGGKSDEW
jgi:hypothetical protein